MRWAAIGAILVALALVWALGRDSGPHAPRAPIDAPGRNAAGPNDADEPEDADAAGDRTGRDELGGPGRTAEFNRWRLTYLGPGGVPLVGLPVDGINAQGGGRTDENGAVTFDARKRVTLLRVTDPYARYGRAIEERNATVRLDGLLPLEVEFRAADSGEAISVSNVRIASPAGDLPIENNRLELSPFGAGSWNRTMVRFNLPPGYTSLQGSAFEFWTSPTRATRLVDATITLWPELELTVVARDIDEQPIEGATIARVYLCASLDDTMTNEIHVEAAPTDKQGRTRIRGVPFLKGYPLTVLVDGGDEESQGFEEIAIGKPKASMTIDCVVDSSVMPTTHNSAIGIGGSEEPELAEWGTAEIQARYRDGTVAAGARCRIPGDFRKSLDELGRASIGKLKPGAYEIWLCEPGRVPTRARFEIKDGENTQVSLREGPGWSLRVRTVDAKGKPLPFRPLTVSLDESRTPYHLVQGGIESIPIQTGADGSVLLPNLGQEDITVAVRIARRTLAKTTLAYDPARRELVLKLP